MSNAWNDRITLLRDTMRQRGVAAADEPITRRDIAAPAVLSFQQQRLWFLNEFDPGAPAYNITYAFRVEGTLDRPALSKAFDELVQRHEVLRTTFAPGPVQRVGQGAWHGLQILDLLHTSPHQRKTQSLEIAAHDARAPFDLSNGPLLRASLVHFASNDHTLVVTVHHIAFDGWSAAVFFEEISELYASHVTARAPLLPELPVQYADYAAWQRTTFEPQIGEQLSWWKEQLSGAPALLELPLDHPRPASQTCSAGTETLHFDRTLVSSLKGLAGDEKATLFMVLLAGFQALLYRYTGAKDVVTGTAIANRSRKEVERLVGFFVNTLALRTQIDPQANFRALLRSVQQSTLDAYARQSVPFEKLVQELQPDRSLSHTPLFQTMLILQNAPESALRLHDALVREIELPDTAARFDLELRLGEDDGELNGVLVYNSDLFEPETAWQIGRHFEQFLAAVTNDPERPLATVPFMTSAEQRQLLEDWNPADIDPPRCCVHEMFEAAARVNPDAIAIDYDGTRLTYGELNDAIQRIAACLSQARGFAAILLPPSPDAIAAILGVIKAGLAYAFLDPEYPSERLAQILEQSRPALLISAPHEIARHRATLERQPQHSGREFTIFSVQDLLSNFEPPRPPATAPGLDDPVYVVFTSGSTGRPKGIVQTHRGLSQYLEWQGRELHHGPGQRIASWASLAYDASYCEIFGALCFGATLCMTAQDVRHDAAALVNWVRRQRISILQLPPSFCAQVMREVAPGTLPDLHILMLPGEVFSPELARQIAQRVDARTYNLYGPTECILASFYAIESSTFQRFHAVPLGTAIDGRRLWILDQYQQLCPVGVWGEIYIVSDYLADGYLDAPGETAKAFSLAPAAFAPPRRMYRTGDIGRWLRAGLIEFGGRRDTQVKLRGIRVELAEIETVLGSHPDITECAVAVRDYGNGDQRLHAFIVAKRETDACSLQAFLSARLPQSIVPSAFTALDHLPRTASRKIDRKSLREMAPALSPSSDGYSAPRTPTEEAVARVWQAVLGVERLGRESHFFLLGGHSILATQVVNRLRRDCELELPVRALFESPTLAGLASRIDSIRQRAEDQEREQIAALVRQMDTERLQALLAGDNAGVLEQEMSK